MANVAYEADVAAWATSTAALLRSRNFSTFTADDIEHLADEIEDVGKSEARELKSRVAVLICHLLKWQYQPARRGRGWQTTINDQRWEVADKLIDVPSLKPSLNNPRWILSVWKNGRAMADKETEYTLVLPDECQWTMEKILQENWFPD
jgi:uncharacterized protein (DUF4415 family)